MTTQAAIRQRMLAIEPSLGEVQSIASIAVQTLTVTALATGSVQSGKYVNKWLLRPGLAAANVADRVRVCSNFASSTGLLTQAGAAYGDTTATGESVEIHEYRPYEIDRVIQRAMQTCRFLDTAILPVNASGMYWLDAYDWIDEPSVIREVRWDAFPVLTNNRFMQQWNGYSSAGALVPDYFALSGVFSRQPGNTRGKWRLRSPASAWSVTLTIGLLEVDDDQATLRGKTVTGVAVASTGTAGDVKVTVSDGVDSTDSAFVPGSGTRAEVAAEHTIAEDATTLTLTLSGTAQTDISELYLCFGALTNGIRVSNPQMRQRWPGWALQWQQGQPLRMDALGVYGYGTRLALVTQRPYAPFDATRVAQGLADQDETDAPLDTIAYQAVALFFEGRRDGQDGNATDAAKADLWRRKADALRAQHLASSDAPGINTDLLSQRGSQVMARVR